METRIVPVKGGYRWSIWLGRDCMRDGWASTYAEAAESARRARCSVWYEAINGPYRYAKPGPSAF